MFKYVFYV